MKRHQIEFETTKGVQTIADILRKVKCDDIVKLETAEDPFGEDNGPVPDIAVLMCGKGTLSPPWGVQVIVTDLGKTRYVELVALGEDGMGDMMNIYAETGGGLLYYMRAKQRLSFSASRKQRDIIYEKLK